MMSDADDKTREHGKQAPPPPVFSAPPERDLNRWMAAVERVLGSHD